MQNKGLVSVIVPVYNVEKYLHECIESVLKQTYTNFELILVDDGSKDSSGEICDYYAQQDERLKVFHKENGGASSARNYGVNKTIGEYIYFLDSDDWLNEKTLELLVECSKVNHADIIFFDAFTVEQETGEISTTNYFHKKKYLPGTGTDVMAHMIKNKEFRVSPCLLFFKKDFYDRTKLLFKEGIMYEDMLFSYQAFLLASKVAYLPEFLYYRRYRRNSVMTAKKVQKNFKSAFGVYENVRDFSSTLEIEEEEFAKQHIVRCAFNVFNDYRILSKVEKKECLCDYQIFRENVLMKKAYGNTALKVRCYGYVPWIIYKIYSKLRGI